MQEAPPSPMVLRYFLVIFLVVILLLGRLLWPFLAILILSYLLASLFRPVYTFFNKKISASLASLLTCTLIVLLVFVPLVFFVLSLSQEALNLYQSGKAASLAMKIKDLQNSDAMARLLDILASFGIALEPESVSNTASELIKMTGLYLYNQISGWAANILLFIFNFFMMILTIFFLLIDSDKLVSYVLTLSPLPDDQERRLIKKFEEIAGAILIGNGICGLIQGVLGGALFAILELGPAVLWGGVMGVLAFLPIFGIGLVLIPTGLILLIKGDMSTGMAVLLFYLLLSFSVEYILKPKMVGKQVHMHTLLVFLGIMGGLSVFGFMGIIYGPLVVTAFLTMADIYMTSYDKYVKVGFDK
ncbi:AI-2E family transporter [Thiovibrio sp. JS02]